ncbi:MAG: pentapeptide repeat-containing protein [Bacteroidetes bacterium]|nr:pentapeptide repeat-containing protein [Bacteroidota bacterium]MDA1120590.1 pentapeptide repeat-containing protein [Bacteroidota bacterium]
MSDLYIEGQVFDRDDFSKRGLEQGEYENCSFNDCILSNADLKGSNFIACEFKNCDLSTAKIINTAFREIKFKNCKMLGLHFNTCNPFLFSAEYESCQLNLSSFYKCSLKNTIFEKCSLNEVDFAESDLTSSTFNNCDLIGATFEHTILEKADFRMAYNFLINPETNRIKKAKFSMAGVAGLLSKYDIEIE